MNARRRRRRRSKSSGAASAPKSGNGQSKKKGSNSGSKPFDAAAFWGDKSALPTPASNIRITGDPTGMLRSLGPMPLGNHQTAAGLTISPIYERAVMLATALAAAGELVETDSL